MRNKKPVVINNLQEDNKLNCFYGRFVKMHKKKYFQINKEKILEIRKFCT
jgi:hypothetical protein